MERTHDKLSLCCLTPEQRERTCSYWYLVREHHGPHTAFRTRAALTAWLDLLRIRLTLPLPDDLGTHQYQPLTGAYRTHMTGSWRDLPASGTAALWLSNGEYTTAVLTRAADGIVTAHYSGPSDPERAKWDYATASRREDEGRKRLDGFAPVGFLRRAAALDDLRD